MFANPFKDNLTYVNDRSDFKMPYRLYGRTDEDVCRDKYMKLAKASRGYTVRCGVSEKG